MNRTMMMVGACALFLVACTAESATPTGTPPATAAATTDAKAVLELGKDV